MKIISRADVRLLTAVILTAVLASPAAAKNNVPFKGTIDSVETTVAVFPPDVPFPTLLVEGSGSGHATHLGAYTVTFTFEVNLDDFTATGFYELVAANGDRVFTEVVGQGTVPDEDGISFLTATHTITGAIVGVGATNRLSAVRWGLAGRIVWAWVITIPAAAIMAAIAYKLLAFFVPM